MATISPAHAVVQPYEPATGHPSPVHPIQLHADAHNALTMALHYLRQPTANVPGAARKTVQALAALRALFVLNTPDAAHTAAQAQQVLREAGHV